MTQQPGSADGIEAATRSFVPEYVARHYAMRPVAVALLQAGAGRAIYRLQDAAGDAWVLRLYRQDRPAPAWFGGGQVLIWLRRRAELLAWLVASGFPAPRLRYTRAAAPVSTNGTWCGLLTNYWAGQRLAHDGADWPALAANVGRLHVLGHRRQPDQPPLAVDSWWHPLARAVRFARRRLAAADVPPAWRPLHAACVTTLAQFDGAPPLPTGCIHADVWAGNAIRGPAGEIRLIDWDAAGQGAMVLDLGAMLGDCFGYPGPGVAPHAEWITAVLDEYTRVRSLTPVEVEMLPAAIQFGAAFRTAVRLELARQQGWEGNVRRGLAHEQARLDASAGIASVAARRLQTQS